MMTVDLKGKKALVTGSARGIGKAIAEKYAENGADVVMMDINEEQLIAAAKEVAEKYGVKTYPIKVDASSTESVNAAVSQAFNQAGTIDILANSAGVAVGKQLVDIDDKDWDFVVDINLRGSFTFCKLIAKRLIENKQKGRIINISSQASKLGERGNGIYCISKAGVNMMTQVLGLELAEYGISVNAIAPGVVNTEMWQEVCDSRGPLEGITPQEYHNRRAGTIPYQRLCEPDDVADLALYLASDNAEYVTGITITIAGGTTLI